MKDRYVVNKYKILVAGASGYVGSLLVPRLLDKSYAVRCVARDPEKLRGRHWPGVEIVPGDVLHQESLLSAMQGVDVAYYLVHGMGQSGDFEQRDILSARNFAAAAAGNKVQRIIYLGGLGDESTSLSAHLRSRQMVGKVLAETTVPVTELRASIIIGAGSASFEIIRDLVKKLPVMITPRWVKSKAEPIAIADVLTYLVACLEEPRTVGQVLEIGGGQVITYGEMMRRVARIMGRRIRLIAVPVLTPHLSAYWLNLVTAVPMSLAFPLVEGLKNDTFCRDFRIREWIQFPLVPFEDAVKEALQFEKSGTLASRWTDATTMGTATVLPTHFHYHHTQEREANIPSEKVFGVVQRVGGQTGWYYADWIWNLRGVFDRLIGGVGMRRGRRDPFDLRVGDAVDFWRVAEFDPPRKLTLRAEMKLPGVAYLSFEVLPVSEGKSRFIQKALFYPRGLWGRLYWFVLIPIHAIIFGKMAQRIIARAQTEAFSRIDK